MVIFIDCLKYEALS